MSKSIRSFLKLLATASALAPAALLGAGIHHAEAGTYKKLHVFCAANAACPDGVNPNMEYSNLLMDKDGNLFGTTTSGGNTGSYGVVFELMPPPLAGTHWTEKVLYKFCPAGGICSDGRWPDAGLTMDSKGNLYGTAQDGGNANHGGVVFELVKPTSGTHWTEKVLHRFCAQGGNCVDGSHPHAPPVMDATGKLFGTTSDGGGAMNAGVVYELIPPASGSTWTYKVIDTLCSVGGCSDGSAASGLLVGSDGNLYGEAFSGGNPSSAGLVFRLVPTNASRTNWNFETLYKFCGGGARPCVDGSNPDGGLIMDASGRLFGTAMFGGAYDHGIVFLLTPPATGTVWTQRILYSFCKQGGTCPDGTGTSDGPLFRKAGKFYGVSRDGGNANNAGVLYELDPPAPGGKWTEKVLHRFCGQGGICPDGEAPRAGVVVDQAGHVFGAASDGGTDHGAGLLFEYAP